ncbi:hypothetical protein M2352_004823 [Azospirillum fermentarium]|uniref:hypothetical protein n=1 Tax=Azospirillum fermentarium TaxID=1233114 RepID=UPI002226DB74|nr:hypothetical protein [Azospirillum fermentarium]MCW2249163.1 hypothetical protein [Azospirillum fermentarium]
MVTAMLRESMHQGSMGMEAGATGRGVVIGKYFNLNPLPPTNDVLGSPLVVADLPTHKLPKEGWRSRLGRIMAGLHLGRQPAQMRLRWKIHDTIGVVLASISPATTLASNQPGARKKGGRTVVVRHPYHLRSVFDFIPQIPEELAPERRFLELLMSRVLRKYGEQLGQNRGVPFSFENEAKEYFYSGYKMERQIKRISAPDERFTALQAIYDAYFHGRNYYYYALLRRERMNPENKLFMLFARACYFMARIDWSGQLADKPNIRQLPRRADMMFYVQRDKSVLERYRTDPDFQKSVKSVLDAFPE